jgi:serine/threonine protein kinase
MSGRETAIHQDRQQVGVNERERETQEDNDAPESVDSLLRAVALARPRELADLPTVEVPNGPQLLGESGTHPPLRLPRVGDLLDERYLLEAVLGMGGMGVVYAARNLRTDKEVAIKYVRLQEGTEQQRKERASRFVREAKAAGRIRHANVVDVYDVNGDRVPYLVMERLHGESLGQRMKRGPLQPGEALNIVLGAMRGVAEAHKQGVVHRDLKPDNIFLARATEHSGSIPKVLDFGVSRLVERDGDDARLTTITRSGHVIGTPVYMPLEQLRGESNVDARADIFALGVVLYEALSGHRPYKAKNDQDLLIKLATEPPTPLAAYLPDVDPGLDAVIARALARRPDDRYRDVWSFMRAIEKWLAAPDSRRSSRLWFRRSVWLSLLVGAAIVALAAWQRGAAEDAHKASSSMIPDAEKLGRVQRDSLEPASWSAAPHRTPAASEAGGHLHVLPAERAEPAPPAPHSTRPTKRSKSSKPLEPATDRATKILPTDF